MMALAIGLSAQIEVTSDYDKGFVTVKIFNAQGIQVRNFSMKDSATINVSDLPAGIYVVNVIGGQVVTKKVIVE